MNDLHDSLWNKTLEVTKRHAEIIEDRIKNVIVECDCKPSDIILETHVNFHYKILVKKDEFKFDLNFRINNDE